MGRGKGEIGNNGFYRLKSNMTHLITSITEKSILMASDTRLNYHNEGVGENGEKYMVIRQVADCCRKTFFLESAKIGIPFIGIGFLEDGDKRYHLSHFLLDIEANVLATDNIELRMEQVFKNLKKITTEGDIGNYVNGVMAGYSNDDPFIATFNTFNGNLNIKKVQSGDILDSEKKLTGSQDSQVKIIEQINDAIKHTSMLKPHLVGKEVEILKITKHKAEYIQEAKKLFSGSQEKLLKDFRENPSKINGKILESPVVEKLNV